MIEAGVTTKFILLAWLSSGHVTSAEFNGADACDTAGKAFLTTSRNSGWTKSWSGYVCVYKGPEK